MAVAVAMDFFEHQDRARKKTSLLIFYYVLAVILIVVAVYLAFAGTFMGVKVKTGDEFAPQDFWNPDLFTWVAGGTLLIVLAGSAYKISQLSGGGESVARMLGGRIINANTRDPNERKILNVVEEMAVASGTPVPPVFILDNEEGINAFAAGFTPSDAVIGVTRGCVRQLTRDELQGVIAHEFSHILNGDMRLNIRLIGVLHGILVIGMLGYWIFRTSLHSGSSRSRSEKGGNKLPIVLLGLIVMIIGYVGVFFGKLIKSAVSRQREFLADASAVQFTRNPAGISGALKRIAGFTRGSRLKTPNAEVTSHFFFSNGLASSLANLMATHPPLEERIRRIDPYFGMELDHLASAARDGEAVAAGFGDATARIPPDGGRRAVAAGASEVAGAPAQRFSATPDDVASSVGNPKPEHLRYASDLLAGLPAPVRAAVSETSGARAVIYSLLLNTDETPRKTQLEHLREYAEAMVCAETISLYPLVRKMGYESHLPLANLAMPALKELSLDKYTAFRENVESLVKADRQIDLFEFALQRMIMRHLDPAFKKVKPPAARHRDIAPLARDCATLLSCLAWWGADKETDAQAAFLNGARAMEFDPLTMLAAGDCGLAAVDAALAALVEAAPAIKKRILKGCVACVGSDGKVTIEEAELLRAVADSLDCPIPPFLG